MKKLFCEEGSIFEEDDKVIILRGILWSGLNEK